MYTFTCSVSAIRRFSCSRKRGLTALAFVGILSAFATTASAQFHINQRGKGKSPYPKDKIDKIAKEVRADGWIVFRADIKDKPKDIASKHKQELGLGEADELRLTEDITDELDITRYRYAQYHGNLLVEGADFSVYSKGERPTHGSGRLVQTLTVPQLPIISERTALITALSSVPAKRYQWQDKRYEQDLRTSQRDSSATHFPKGKLLYALTTNDGNAEEAIHRLAYRFDIMRLDPQAYEAIYIDALTGKLLRITSLISNSSCQNNQVDTWYNGNLRVGTYWDSSRNRYSLRDFCRGGYIYTKYTDSNNYLDFPNGYFIEAGGSESSPLNTNWNWDFKAKSAASTHWAVQATHYYFQQKFSRNGAPNYNRDTRVLVGNIDNNAYSFEQNGADYITIGRWNFEDGRSLAETDIVAHEFTHGVVRASAGLRGGEADALNESFADIFGEMVDWYNSRNHDWILGRHGGIRRAFARVVGPSFTNAYIREPAQVYQGDGWDFNGEPHQNGGVQNRWFYLLSVGFSNPNFSVTGIGEEKASRIAYRNLTRYLAPNSTFANARTGAIQAAIELYGDCSAEVVATTNAWAAVGVGAAAPQSCAAQITGTPSFCVEDGSTVYAQYRVQASPGANKTWSISNGAFSFSQLGTVDYVTLYQVPTYATSATLSVYISYPNNAAANLWRYYTINTIVCSPPPPYCPPGQICPVEVQQAAQQVQGSGNKDKIDSGEIIVYPNPADMTATLDLGTPTLTPTTILLRDMLGRIVYTQQVPPGTRQVSLNVTRLPAGSFILSVTTNKGVTSRRFHISR